MMPLSEKTGNGWGTSSMTTRCIACMAGRSYDYIVCAGLPVTKWWINQHPDEDLANLGRLHKALSKAECKCRFVLISTIDVPNVTRPDGQDENNVTPADHAYGKHRLMMEDWVKEQ
jgi:nucleoside-diphosphate-sugar epimerase